MGGWGQVLLMPDHFCIVRDHAKLKLILVLTDIMSVQQQIVIISSVLITFSSSSSSSSDSSLLSLVDPSELEPKGLLSFFFFFSFFFSFISSCSVSDPEPLSSVDPSNKLDSLPPYNYGVYVLCVHCSVCIRMCMCVCACVRACVRVCTYACMYVYVHTQGFPTH